MILIFHDNVFVSFLYFLHFSQIFIFFILFRGFLTFLSATDISPDTNICQFSKFLYLYNKQKNHKHLFHFRIFLLYFTTNLIYFYIYQTLSFIFILQKFQELFTCETANMYLFTKENKTNGFDFLKHLNLELKNLINQNFKPTFFAVLPWFPNAKTKNHEYQKTNILIKC